MDSYKVKIFWKDKIRGDTLEVGYGGRGKKINHAAIRALSFLISPCEKPPRTGTYIAILYKDSIEIERGRGETAMLACSQWLVNKEDET